MIADRDLESRFVQPAPSLAFCERCDCFVEGNFVLLHAGAASDPQEN